MGREHAVEALARLLEHMRQFLEAYGRVHQIAEDRFSCTNVPSQVGVHRFGEERFPKPRIALDSRDDRVFKFPCERYICSHFLNRDRWPSDGAFPCYALSDLQHCDYPLRLPLTLPHMLREFPYHGIYLLLEKRQVSLDCSPHFPQINPKVVVDQDMTHLNDLWPWDVLMAFTEGRREFAGSFTNNLNVMNHPGVDEFVFFERATAPFSISLDLFDGI